MVLTTGFAMPEYGPTGSGAEPVMLTQRRVIDFGVVTSTSCR
jgi:hypothetical protein